jgi:hypothetical protein
MSTRPTFIVARNRILDAYSVMKGFHVKRDLKVPQVITPTGDVLYFRTQAVYLNAHSTWIDIREVSVDQFMANIDGLIMSRNRKV